MKLSLSWIFDHIAADVTTIDINTLVATFNKKVAEIEGVVTVVTEVNKLLFVQVTAITDATTEVVCPELNISLSMPLRTDAITDVWYLVIANAKGGHRWVTMLDIGGEQEGLLPAIQYEAAFADGTWKKDFVTHDYILIVDNKSITHRPDMWGHRGFAREVAAYLGYELKPLDDCLHKIPVHTVTGSECIDKQNNIVVEVPENQAIKRFAAASFTHIHNQPSQLAMATRLVRVGAKPIDALVDATNYVMFDLSQPLHAFDADLISTKKIKPKYAQPGQHITLLDGQQVELTAADIVITDGMQPIALAGIMGGATTAVTASTQAIVVEAALFDATTIRKTATRLKKRTEASARFEKSLDAAQNCIAIERFARLLDDMGMTYKTADIYSFGMEVQPQVLEISHVYIEQEIGTTILVDKVCILLRALEFDVVTQSLVHDTIYTITVPSWRATKDISIPRDIVEEIARLYGYEHIPVQLPRKQTTVSDLHGLYQIRAIKQLLAFGQAMKEVYNYALYDHAFLQQLRWYPEHAVTLQNPVSEHWQQMVTSLVPHLFKNIVQHHEEHTSLRFFEYARIWPQDEQESAELAGIWYDKHNEISFYDLKNSLLQLFVMLELPVSFVRMDDPQEPWFSPYQSAAIMHNDQCIGKLGLMNKKFIYHILPQQSSLALFTLDGNFLRTYRAPQNRFVSLIKYPAVERDISMMVPRNITVDSVIVQVISHIHGIKHVYLVDTFYKPEWQDKKSLTIRCVFQDVNKTLTSQEVDILYGQIIDLLQAMGAEIR